MMFEESNWIGFFFLLSFDVKVLQDLFIITRKSFMIILKIETDTFDMIYEVLKTDHNINKQNKEKKRRKGYKQRKTIKSLYHHTQPINFWTRN